jgi:hypothetical protein
MVIGGKSRGKETARKTKMEVGGMVWLDKDRWRASVNVVMNLWVS